MFKGFTLIELLVVVLIIGILAAIALPQYTYAVEKTRAMEAVVNVRALRDAQNLYLLANGEYATDIGKLDMGFANGATGSGFSTNDFNYRLDEISDTARAHIWGNRRNHSTLRYFIITYMAEQKICCLAAKSLREDNAFCKRFTSTPVTAAVEPGYDCYEIK